MTMRFLLLVNILFFIAVTLNACFDYPGPAFRVYDQTGVLNQTENKVKDLANESATRQRVVETLGVPITYQSDYLSYIACGKQGGVDFYVISGTDALAGWEGGPQYDCFEFVITFGKQGRVSGYKKNPVTDVAQSVSEEQRTQNLREFADKGDRLAQLLLEKTVHYQAELGDGRAQYKLYNSEQITGTKLRWLCRAADSGYAPAQAEVGRLYRWGLLGITPDYQRAYQWYWRANRQAPNSWKGELYEIRQTASKTNIQLVIETDVSDLSANQCEHELLSDI